MADANAGSPLRFLPAGPRALVQRMWRRWYWWNAKRLRPGQSARFVSRLLASGRPIKLELGSSARPGMEDWVAIDLAPGADLRVDLTKPLPFPDSSVERIYSSHFLEHFNYPAPLLDILRECRRVLKPGAELSAAVPNARLYLEGYFHPETFDHTKFCRWPVGLTYENRIDVVNFIAYLGGEHKVLYDEENLPRIIAEAGFRDVRLREFDPSIDMAERQHESIYVQAVK